MATSNNSDPQIDMFINLLRNDNFRNEAVYSIMWILGSKEDCEDIFQETSISILQQIKKGHFSKGSMDNLSFRKYFFTVAKYKGFQKARINLKSPSLDSSIVEAEQQTTNFEHKVNRELKGLEYVLNDYQNLIWRLLKKGENAKGISEIAGKSVPTIRTAICGLNKTVYKFGISVREFEKHGEKTCQKRISELSIKLGISQRTLQFYLNCWQR